MAASHKSDCEPTNALAADLFLFLAKHHLSLYKVAGAAKMSEGTLRFFRDVPGRELTATSIGALANALSALTGEPVDIKAVFGDWAYSASACEICLPEPTLSDRAAELEAALKGFLRWFGSYPDLVPSPDKIDEVREMIDAAKALVEHKG